MREGGVGVESDGGAGSGGRYLYFIVLSNKILPVVCMPAKTSRRAIAAEVRPDVALLHSSSCCTSPRHGGTLNVQS